MTQPRQQAREIAGAVVVAVEKAREIDLIDRGPSPPLSSLHPLLCSEAAELPAAALVPRSRAAITNTIG